MARSKVHDAQYTAAHLKFPFRDYAQSAPRGTR
jgi:hypothetical protein